MACTLTTPVALNVRCLRQETREAFREWCVLRGVPMEHAIRQIIESIVMGDLTPDVRADDVVEDGNASLNIRRIHFNIRRHFKSWCVLRGVPMEHAIRQIIELIVAGKLTPAIHAD